MEANKIYYKHVSDMEYYPLAWEDYEEGPNANGHDYVDLGLPSGLLWATCNVGATSPAAHGDYFAWGETETKDTYSMDNSETYALDISYLQEQGYLDEKGNLKPEHDAARVNWGGSWRMPTKAEQEELSTKCTWTKTTQNGVSGYNVEGPNGNSIFLPAAGYRLGAALSNSYSGCWSSTPYAGNEGKYGAYALNYSAKPSITHRDRNYGLNVRPVLE